MYQMLLKDTAIIIPPKIVSGRGAVEHVAQPTGTPVATLSVSFQPATTSQDTNNTRYQTLSIARVYMTIESAGVLEKHGVSGSLQNMVLKVSRGKTDLGLWTPYGTIEYHYSITGALDYACLTVRRYKG